jgi:hypothetical protein
MCDYNRSCHNFVTGKNKSYRYTKNSHQQTKNNNHQKMKPITVHEVSSSISENQLWRIFAQCSSIHKINRTSRTSVQVHFNEEKHQRLFVLNRNLLPEPMYITAPYHLHISQIYTNLSEEEIEDEVDKVISRYGGQSLIVKSSGLSGCFVASVDMELENVTRIIFENPKIDGIHVHYQLSQESIEMGFTLPPMNTELIQDVQSTSTQYLEEKVHYVEGKLDAFACVFVPSMDMINKLQSHIHELESERIKYQEQISELNDKVFQMNNNVEQRIEQSIQSLKDQIMEDMNSKEMMDTSMELFGTSEGPNTPHNEHDEPVKEIEAITVQKESKQSSECIEDESVLSQVQVMYKTSIFGTSIQIVTNFNQLLQFPYSIRVNFL